MSRTSSCNNRIYIPCCYYSVFVKLMNIWFFGNNKTCSHLYSLGTKHKCCTKSSCICNSTSCYYRNWNCISHLWNKCHCSLLTDMPTWFHSFSYNHISTCSLHEFCKCNWCYNRHNFNSCIFPHFHVFSGISCSCWYNRYFLFNNNLCNFIYMLT